MYLFRFYDTMFHRVEAEDHRENKIAAKKRRKSFLRPPFSKDSLRAWAERETHDADAYENFRKKDQASREHEATFRVWFKEARRRIVVLQQPCVVSSFRSKLPVELRGCLVFACLAEYTPYHTVHNANDREANSTVKRIRRLGAMHGAEALIGRMLSQR